MATLAGIMKGGTGMGRWVEVLMLLAPLVGACVTPGPTSSTRVQQAPLVQGDARREIVSDRETTDAAVKAAETYWNAQKTADSALFRTVTPHESMNVIFEWSFVNKSEVVCESGQVAGIKYHLDKFNVHQNNYRTMPKYTKASIRELEAAAAYAKAIENGGYQMLGSLMQKGYWDAVIPTGWDNIAVYKLMNMQHIADVKAQSKRGSVLQKRVTLQLYRMQTAEGDSGWKVLFVQGLHNLPPLF